VPQCPTDLLGLGLTLFDMVTTQSELEISLVPMLAQYDLATDSINKVQIIAKAASIRGASTEPLAGGRRSPALTNDCEQVCSLHYIYNLSVAVISNE
jgi:hypothetical protein